MAQININKDDLKKMELGALIDQHVIFQDPVMGTTVIEYEFELGTIHKTMWYGEQTFMDGVKELRNTGSKTDLNSALGTKVASIPMHIWAREVAPRTKDGNEESLKKWLNDGAGKAFKVRDGNI